MTESEFMKWICKQIDSQNINAKSYRKSHNFVQEAYHRGSSDVLSKIFSMIIDGEIRIRNDEKGNSDL